MAGYDYFLCADHGEDKDTAFALARQGVPVPDVEKWVAGNEWQPADWLQEYIANEGSDAKAYPVTEAEAKSWQAKGGAKNVKPSAVGNLKKKVVK